MLQFESISLMHTNILKSNLYLSLLSVVLRRMNYLIIKCHPLEEPNEFHPIRSEFKNGPLIKSDFRDTAYIFNKDLRKFQDLQSHADKRTQAVFLHWNSIHAQSDAASCCTTLTECQVDAKQFMLPNKNLYSSF